ncbi:MAG: aldo/keto reductase [Bacteroidales bacterium]|jgi:aryl-alcohol dehydrogenase-like predicted oxidoreductase|nr:aldo/keto reductase [Bacteroidales bacterium]
MNYTRRKFIGTVAAGIGILLGRTAEGGTGVRKHDPFEKVKLGKSGITTTRLCLGTGIRGGGQQSNLTRLGYDNGVQLVRNIYHSGVRMVDMADTYGTHFIVGDALKIYPRKKYTLFTKIWLGNGEKISGTPVDIDAVLQRFLKELQTEYIDGVMMHCITSGNWNSVMSDYMTALDKAKQRGMIRSHGLSCHSLAAVETAVSEAWTDCIHVRFNPFGVNMDDRPEKVAPVVRQLHDAGTGVIAMKIFGEGKFADDSAKKDQSLTYALHSGAVDVLDIGMDKIEDLTDTITRIRAIPK